MTPILCLISPFVIGNRRVALLNDNRFQVEIRRSRLLWISLARQCPETFSWPVQINSTLEFQLWSSGLHPEAPFKTTLFIMGLLYGMWLELPSHRFKPSLLRYQKFGTISNPNRKPMTHILSFNIQFVSMPTTASFELSPLPPRVNHPIGFLNATLCFSFTKL